MFKLLDRYILKTFLLNLFIGLMAWIVIFLVVDMIENISRFIDNKASLEQFLLYYLYYIPYIINLTLPIAMLLSALFTLNIFAQHNEVVAQLSSGVSLYRLLAPLFILAFMISIGAGFFNELIVPEANQQRFDILRYDVQKKARPSQKSRSNIYLQDSANRAVNVKFFNGKTRQGRNVSIKTYAGSVMTERLDARIFIWKEDHWQLKDGRVRQFKDQRESMSVFKDTLLHHLRIKPQDLILMQKKPEEMSFVELNKFIGELKAIGADVRKWLVERHLKIAFPLANFIVVLLGAPLASRKRRGGMGLNFGISLLVTFIYFIIIRTGQVLGYRGVLNPVLGAWLGNLIFMTLGLISLLRVRK